MTTPPGGRDALAERELMVTGPNTQTPGRRRGLLLLIAVWLAVIAALGVSAVLTARNESPVSPAPLVGHVHGIAIEPDGRILIGAHFGVFRVSRQGGVEVAGERRSDTMALTDAGAGSLIASGHPDLTDPEAPINAGLIQSADGARTWQTASLAGDVDFHALDHVDGRTWGIDSVSGRLLTSTDQTSWTTIDSPPALDLAVDPSDPARILMTDGEGGLRSLAIEEGVGAVKGGPPLLLVDWPRADRLVGLTATGDLYASPDGGHGWTRVGSVPGDPTALASDGVTDYVATTDGLFSVRDGDETALMVTAHE